MMMDPSLLPSLLPLGVVFKPTEREILQEFLTRKVHGLPLPNNAITEMDVYGNQPWLYTSGHNYGMDQYEKYYFVRREKKSKCKYASAKNPERHIKSKGDSSIGGWWKAITGDKPISNKRGHIIGFKKTLKFYTYKNQKYDRRECVKTDWIMHEYRLPHPTFQEWVICGIRYNSHEETEEEYASRCHSTLVNRQAQDMINLSKEEQLQWPDQHFQQGGCSMLEDQQAQAHWNSPRNQICNASSQPNIGSNGQCCWTNVCYSGLNEQEYASECHLTVDNQQAQARDSRSLELIGSTTSNGDFYGVDDLSWNEFEDVEGSQIEFPHISFTESELQDGRLNFDL